MAEVVSTLLAKRAEILGHIEYLEKKASRWRARLAVCAIIPEKSPHFLVISGLWG